MHIRRNILVMAALLLCVSGCATWPLERAMLYQPAAATVGDWRPPAEIGFEECEFRADDRPKLHGWFLDHPDRRAVVLFTHGNGGNVAMWGRSLQYLVERHHVAALVFDYRGYGKSDGKPSEQGVLQDARAAREWLAERTGVTEQSIVLMGQSLGGGVAVDLAANDGARGLVLVSTFTSAPDVAAHHLPWLPVHLLMTQRFNSLSKIKHYHGPLLMCHGDADRVIPFAQGEELFATAPTPQKKFIRHVGGDHNDPPPDSYRAALDQFLSSLPPEVELTGPRRMPPAPGFLPSPRDWLTWGIVDAKFRNAGRTRQREPGLRDFHLRPASEQIIETSPQ